MRLNSQTNWRDKVKRSMFNTTSNTLSALPRKTTLGLMSPAHLAPEDEDAIELLVGKFTRCPSDSLTREDIVDGLR